MKHISLDTESLSLNENPALLSIGAVVFDPYGNDTVESLRRAPNIQINIAPRGQVECYGRHIDGDTVLWWLKQSDAARAQLTEHEACDLPTALARLSTWIFQRALQPGDTPTARLWTHGAAEDAVWLRTAYRTCGHQFPIHYRNIRDTRTLFDLTDTPPIQVSGLVDHVALDDAIYQALWIQAAHKQLNQLKEAA